MMCSQRVSAASVMVLKLRPGSAPTQFTRAAITTASTNPKIRGHLTVVNGFMRFPSIKLCVGSRHGLGSCVVAAWKNRGLTPIIQRCPRIQSRPVVIQLTDNVESVDYGPN